MARVQDVEGFLAPGAEARYEALVRPQLEVGGRHRASSLVAEGLGLDPFFFSSRRRHTSSLRDWSSDVCSSDLFDCRGGRAAPDERGYRVALGRRWVQSR